MIHTITGNSKDVRTNQLHKAIAGSTALIIDEEDFNATTPHFMEYEYIAVQKVKNMSKMYQVAKVIEKMVDAPDIILVADIQ